VSPRQIMTELGLSELQIALSVIGLVILALVAFINLRYAKRRSLINRKADHPTSDVAAEFNEVQGFAEPSMGSRTEPGFFLNTLKSSVDLSERQAIDPRIDCVISLRFDEPIGGTEILSEMGAWFDLGVQSNARWMCEGLSIDSDSTKAWGHLQRDTSYSELQLAIQLASRRGPIGVLELSDFCSRAQTLAETLGSQIDMPSVSAMLESAKELDILASESDIQLSINILFDRKLSWSELQVIMLQRGFRLAQNGRQFEFFRGQTFLFNTADINPSTSIAQLTLLLEIPLVPNNQHPFERMLSEGIEIVQSSQGRLVDDNGITLTEASVISIRQHLDALYANLEKSGVAAGSSTASRLFS